MNKHIWQPIETCPRDEIVMVWAYNQAMFVRWIDVDEMGNRIWKTDGNDLIDDDWFKPIHWKPYPKGPN